MGEKNTLKLSITYNKDKLNSYIESLSKDINVSMKNARLAASCHKGKRGTCGVNFSSLTRSTAEYNILDVFSA